MPATPTRIGFIREEFRRAVAETPAVKTRHGNLSRESDDPIETFFDNVADAQTVANERQAMLSAERNRFRATTVGVTDALGLDYVGAVPVAHFVDTVRGHDKMALVSEIVINLTNQKSFLTVWG